MSNKFLLQDTTWQYQRLSAFEQCKYGWYLRYLQHKKSNEEHFFSQCGQFVHKILEMHLGGEMSAEDTLQYFMDNWDTEVKGAAPNQAIGESFFNSIVQYFTGFQFPYKNIIATEKEVRFDIDGYKFVGYIDVLAEEDGELVMIDHKSHKLRNRSGRPKPTTYDKELDQYLRQQYLYCIPLIEEYGKPPKTINFNCFRAHSIVSEEFDPKKLEEVKAWAVNTIHQIEDEAAWEPSPDQFFCHHLCDSAQYCEYCPRKKWQRK